MHFFNEIFVRITKLYGYRYLVKTQVYKNKYATALAKEFQPIVNWLNKANFKHSFS